MKNRLLMAMLTVALASCSKPAPQAGNYPNNRAPLAPKHYIELPLGAVRPAGWLEVQLKKQAEGMTGHLDEIVPNIMGDRNGWLGGDGDKWERGPYWIDGLVPLAYILDDETLKAKAQRWIDWTLSSQQEDGFFGPSEDLPNVDGLQRDRTHDWWPRMVVLKFLQQYYDATSDERVIDFMTKYFRYQLATLPETPLGEWSYWGVERGADNLLVVYWLYNITGEPFLLDLGKLLAEQTADWKGRLSDHNTLSTRYALHCVNLAQGFKTPVIEYQATGDDSYIEACRTGYEDLMKFLGWPNGMYGSDELLHSASPTQGSEMCSAVELMYSLERMIEIAGLTEWADWLERVAFNALPTQATDDYDGRQYYQQLNQVEVSCRPRNFMTCYNGTEGCFGPLTGFPCCTANMHQGWPKFVRDLWYATPDNGLAAMYYAPCEVTAKVADGKEVTIIEDGGYPFTDCVRFTVAATSDNEPVRFKLAFRIPGWCEEAVSCLNGGEVSNWACGETAYCETEWKSGDVLELHFPMKVKVSRWYENSAAIERGPLVYALRMNENWAKVKNGTGIARYGEWFYEVRSDTPWNWCFSQKDLDNPEESFTLVENFNGADYPWNLENAPLSLKVKARRMPQWQMYDGSCGPLPYSNQYQADLGPEEEITLIPYGCTTLRVTEFPVTDQ